MKNTAELRDLSVDELQTELLSLRKDQFNMRLRKAHGTLDKTHLIKDLRRTIARVKTILTEKAGK